MPFQIVFIQNVELNGADTLDVTGMEHYTITHVLDIPGQTDTLSIGSYRGWNITLQNCTCFKYTRTDRHLHLWRLQGTEHYTFTHVLDIPGQTDRHVTYWKLQGTEHYTSDR